MNENAYVMGVTGTHIWYYFICKRELWLILHQIAADQEDESLDLGRFINEHTYQRSRKEWLIGNIKVDRVRKENGRLVIGEVKKSSSYKESSRYQLLYYLLILKRMGIDARGELLFPEERNREQVELTDEAEWKLDQVIEEVRNLALTPVPPQPERIKYCSKCAYREYCWAEG